MSDVLLYFEKNVALLWIFGLTIVKIFHYIVRNSGMMNSSFTEYLFLHFFKGGLIVGEFV